MEASLLTKDFGFYSDKSNLISVEGKTKKHSPRSKKSCSYSLTWCVLSALVISMLLCWNAYVGIELARLNQSVNALSSRDCPCISMKEENGIVVDHRKAKSWQLSGDETNDSGDDLFEDIKGNSDALSQMQNHSLVKRSLGKSSNSSREGRRRKGRKRIRNRVKQLLKKNKAVAIHVQAKRTSNNLENPLSIPGRKLKGWLPPDPRYAGFDTTFLMSDGYVTVPANGLYFVYSQVIFRTSNLPYMVAEIGVKTFGATAFTKCQISANHSATVGSYVACHSSGVVYLRKGEGISLIVNPLNVQVYMAPEYTYFGAFLLGLN